MNKDPTITSFILEWMSIHIPTIYAFLMSICIAVLRVAYSGGGLRKMFLEGSLCGALTLTTVSALDWLGIPSSAATFVGGGIAFIGVEQLRELAMRFLGNKIGEQK
ncbi:phage holin, lambda family [Photobacterium sagamiensis]|uniref:phage holin, lambda family n=1 Tax=Photobacterium sagamiensis TaxID=2910241 RepID=UPI003D0A6E82